MIKLTLVMATLGRRDEVFSFVESVSKSSEKSFELIVVDQNDNDLLNHLESFALDKGVHLRHIRISERGLSNARNVGITAARGEYIAFPDDDCWYEPSTISNAIDILDASISLDGLMGRWAERHGIAWTEKPISLDRLLRFREVPIASIGLFFRSAALHRINGFDRRFGVGCWYGSSEETDLVLRLLEAGSSLHFTPSVVVHHHWDSDLKLEDKSFSAILKQAEARARGTGAIYAKHDAPLWIAIRGILAPSIRTVQYILWPRLAVFQFGTSIGRAAGYIRWLRER